MKNRNHHPEEERQPVAQQPGRAAAPNNDRPSQETREPQHYRNTNRSGGTRDPKAPPQWGEDLVY